MEEVGPDVLSLAVSKHAITENGDGAAEEFSFKSAGATQASALAGALAAKIRENVKLLSVTSVGPSAALRSIKSIAMAASYVKEEGFELYCVPVFVDLKLGEEERTGVRIDVFAVKA
jgi:stage V sporulation protein SpoVS